MVEPQGLHALLADRRLAIESHTLSALSAEEIIAVLGLDPHPEGGHYIRTWSHVPDEGGRGHGSAIYFLLQEGLTTARHRVDAAELWHYYAGAPLELTIEDADGITVHQVLGVDLRAGERPQCVVPPHAWQSARSLGPWTLVGCTVSPAFEFEGFELDERTAPDTDR